jgi:hypothetical protein
MIKQLTLMMLAAAHSNAATTLPATARPAITGISHLAVYSTDAAASEHFYSVVLGARRGADPENPAGVRFYFSPASSSRCFPHPRAMDRACLRMLPTPPMTPRRFAAGCSRTA